MSFDLYNKQVGPFMGVTLDVTKNYRNGRKLRFILYGAYNAFGLVGPESNGIAVLDNEKRQVVTDEIQKESTGYFGPSQQQIEFFHTLTSMSWSQVQSYINNTKRLRYEI